MFSKTINIYKFIFFFLFVYTKTLFCQSIYPTSISGLECWYAADSGITLNGSAVLQIKDLGPNQHHINQTNNSAQPLLLTSQINNKPALNFDGSDDYFPIKDSINFRTIIVLAKANESIFSDYRGLFGGSISTTFTGGYLINANSGTTNLGIGIGTAGLTKIKRNATDVTTTGNFSPIDTYWVGLFEYSYLRKQTADIGRIDNGTQIGRYWKGDIAEIIVYNKTLNSSELNLIEIYLSQKYTPPVSLGPDIFITGNSVCDTTLSTSLNYSQFLWSTGATTPTISVNKPGKYWVRIVNEFGFYSYDTISLIYPNFKQLKTDSVLCIGEYIEWNTNLPKNQYTFQWQDNSTDSLINITSPGQYYVKITDQYGCFINSDTVTIIQDNFPNSISLGPDLNLCAGNSIALKQGLQPNLTYTWSTGENTSAITVTNTGQYSVIATNTNNCIAKDTINVNIIGSAPNVDFSTTLACKNNAVVFTDNSSPPSGNTLSSWYWNFGDGSTLSDTSLVQNPFYTYTDTGNYTINLSVQTNVGCKQNYTKTIHVAPTPSVNFNNLIACQNDTASFSNLSASPNYNPLVFNWNFGDPASGANNTSSSANPKHVFSQQGNFPVKLITTNSVGCKDSLIKTINVKSQVKANFTTSAACKNAPTVFTDNSIVPAPNNQNIRLWTIGTNTYSGTSVTRTFTNTGVYPVTLSVSGLNGCNSSISKYLNVFSPPSTNFTVPTICANDTVNVTNLSLPQSGVLSSYNWKLNNAAYSTVSSPSLSLNSPGNYNLQLSTSNSFGCKDSITKIISVLSLPNVDFTTNPANYYFTNSPITFSPTISNGSFYQWNFNGTLYTSQSFSTNINTAGTYTNSLFMTDAFGCSNTKTKTLTISDYLLDLAVIDVKTQKDNNNFISVEVTLANFGTVPINSFEISYDITDAASNIESWTGTINPGNFYNYTFVSKTNHKASNNNYITCVNINKVNLMIDDNTSNNSQCVTSNANAINIGNPFPNPTNGDVKLPVTLIKDSDITIDLIDALGQTLYSSYTIKGTQGLNLITIPLGNFSQSMYTLKISVADKVYTKKILKSVQ